MGCEWFATCCELSESFKVDPRVPSVFFLEGFLGEEDDARGDVFGDDVVVGEVVEQCLRKTDDFFVVGHVGEGESLARGADEHVGFAFDEVGVSSFDECCVVFWLGHVHVFDEGEAYAGAVLFFGEGVEAFEHALVVVVEEGFVDFFEEFFVGGVDAQVELCDRGEFFYFFPVLCVGDEEGADAFVVEERDGFVDFGVDDGLAGEGERDVLYCVGLVVGGFVRGRASFEADEEVVVGFFAFFYDGAGVVHAPLPVFADRCFVSAPAECASVGAADAGCHLHALVAHNAVELEFVAPSLAAYHFLRPPACFDSAVASDDAVGLFFKVLFGLVGKHCDRGRKSRVLKRLCLVLVFCCVGFFCFFFVFCCVGSFCFLFFSRFVVELLERFLKTGSAGWEFLVDKIVHVSFYVVFFSFLFSFHSVLIVLARCPDGRQVQCSVTYANSVWRKVFRDKDFVCNEYVFEEVDVDVFFEEGVELVFVLLFSFFKSCFAFPDEALDVVGEGVQGGVALLHCLL